jgi:UDP-glucuronate decarboxylase
MHPNDGRVVSNFIVQALRGEALTLYGEGAQTRAFCYVDDMVEGLLRLMASDTAGPINLGNPHEISVLALAEQVVALTGPLTGKPVQIVRRPLPPDDPRQRCPDIFRARSMLGWEPVVPLAEGLRRTVGYFAALLRS